MIDLGSVKVNSLLEAESIVSLYFTVKPCSHACVKLQVNISHGFINQIKNIINEIKGSDVSVEYTDTADNKTKVLFKGIIENFRFSNDLGICICHIEAFSKSLLLDKEKNDRLFQNKEDSIKSVIENVSSKIETRVIYNTEIKKLGQLFLQYRETDWEFIKRIASNFGEVLVADYKSGLTAFYYGMPYGEDMVHFRPDHYESGFEINIYEKKDLLESDHNIPAGDIYYTVSDYNFNNNMKNIRISGKDGTGNLIPPKTISEGEGLENFQECKNFNELMEYMQRYTKNNEYNLFALSLIGLDGTGYKGRITYVMDNGEEKVVRENGVLYLGDLFQDNSQ